MSNERLRTQISSKGLTAVALATAVEVDPKTVERWISSGRVPHQRHRRETSRVLDVEETYLWPELLDDERTRATSKAELLHFYPHRGAVPPNLWVDLIEKAESNIDVLVYAGLFLADAHPDLPSRLASKVGEGVAVRLFFGDPTSAAVAQRGREEGIGDGLAARIELTLRYFEPVKSCIQLHDTTLYNSIYRFDDQMLVNTHVVGSPAAQNPVLHVQRLPGGRVFEKYLTAFEPPM